MGNSMKCQNVENGEEIIHTIMSTMNLKEIPCKRAYEEYKKCVTKENNSKIKVDRNLYSNYVNAVIGHNAYREVQAIFFEHLQKDNHMIIAAIIILFSQGNKEEKGKMLTEIYNEFYSGDSKKMILDIITINTSYCVELFKENLGKESYNMLKDIYNEKSKEKLAELILDNYTGVEKKYFSKSMGSVDNKAMKEKDDNMLREFFNLSLEQLDGEYIRNWLNEEYLKSNFDKKSSLCA